MMDPDLFGEPMSATFGKKTDEPAVQLYSLADRLIWRSMMPSSKRSNPMRFMGPGMKFARNRAASSGSVRSRMYEK